MEEAVRETVRREEERHQDPTFAPEKWKALLRLGDFLPQRDRRATAEEKTT